jgi:FkbM family methyltransferase
MRKLVVLLRLFLKFGLFKALDIYIKIYHSTSIKLNLHGLPQPIFLRKGSTDVAVFEQIYLYNEYNLQFNFEPKVIVDAGANIGLFAVKMKGEFPHAKVICIEPDPENFEQLKRNVAGYNNIILENAGLWSHETVLKVYDKHDQGKWGIVVEEDLEGGNIKAISIPSLMSKHKIERIDILKIDIESSEKELFSENYQAIFAHSKMIIVELHDLMKAGCAKAFFTALNHSVKDYTYMLSGENTIIINNDIG